MARKMDILSNIQLKEIKTKQSVSALDIIPDTGEDT